MVNCGFKFRVVGRVLSLVLVGVAVCAWGQDAKTTLVMPPAPLLPQHFAAWQMDGAATEDGTAGTDAALLKEFGIARSSEAKYKRERGGTIAVDAIQFGDATGAFSAFTYLRKPEMKNLSAGKRIGSATASTDGKEFLVLSGTTVMKAMVESVTPTTVDELKELASTLPKVGGPKGQPPLLPTYLPERGLQADSMRYALGPVTYRATGGVLPPEIIGFDKAAEAVTAKYAGKGTLTMLLYPTPQIAGDHGREIEAEMNREGASAGTVKLRRDGPLVLMTTGAWSPDDAQRTIENIHLRTEVTWNKPVPPEFHTEIRKTVSLLSSIAILSGVMMLAAVVLGLFFGGARAMIRVLQGKPAASEPEFLRIDLSGSTHRIRASSGSESKG